MALAGGPSLRRTAALLRLRLRDGWRRVQSAFVPVVQAAFGAGLAFWIAQQFFGHPYPFLAPVAAWVCLGFSKNRQPRKVAELGAGAVLGVLAGEVVHLLVGSGIWQLGVVLVLAALAARMVDRGDMFTMQAGVNAMVVLATISLLTSNPVGRAVDALIGGGVALLLSIVLPRDLTSRPRRQIAGVHTELAAVLQLMAEGLRDGEPERLRDVAVQLGAVRGILDYARTVVSSSSQIVRLHPALRRDRPVLAELERQGRLLSRCLNTLELLLRQGRGVVDESGPQPVVAMLVAEAGGVTDAMSRSIRRWEFPARARARATNLAADCSPAAVMHSTWRSVALVSVMRSVAVDLLQLTGLSRTGARLLLTDMDGATEAGGGTEGTDAASAIWDAAP
jgi:uncharacterized membrane protein YgaE (UPF0421/DUF939 family)